MWEVLLLPEAEAEIDGVQPGTEQVAVDHAIEKLKALGPELPFPHSSAVKGADRLRELRPRGGNSPWRVLYRRVGDTLVIAALGPEAKKDKRGFAKACAAAEERLGKVEE